MKKSETQKTESPSRLIDAKIEKLGDWRSETFKRLRALIHEADPEVVETLKWAKASNPSGVPVFEHDGILCTGETYKDKVKLTFANGAALADPSGLFNSSLDGLQGPHPRGRCAQCWQSEALISAPLSSPASIRAVVCECEGRGPR
jgi:hypothetical protein